MSVTDYCLGFPLNRERGVVLLTVKSKPAWQAGKLNGFGGKIEVGETPQRAMIREWQEEGNHAPVPPLYPSWVLFAVMWFPNKAIRVHCMFAEVEPHQLVLRDGHKTDVDDPMRMVSIQELHKPLVIPNLRWLIPLALDEDRANVVRVECS